MFQQLRRLPRLSKGNVVEYQRHMFRTMIVDDQEIYRGLVRAMLDKEDDFHVVAEAGGGKEAIELMEKIEVDLVLMDVLMADMSGFEAARPILEHRPGTKVILLSRSRRHREYSRNAREAGALAFIPKRDLKAGALRHILRS